VSWLQAVVLGLVQGLTEFLPISSTAHLRIVAELAGWADPGAAFTAVTQIGTETAVLMVESEANELAEEPFRFFVRCFFCLLDYLA